MAGALALPGLALRFGRLTVLRTALFAVPVLLCAYALAPTLAVAMPAFVAVGAAYICVLSGLNTVVQLRAPAEARGSILSIYMMALGLVYPLGAVLQGWLADRPRGPGGHRGRGGGAVRPVRAHAGAPALRLHQPGRPDARRGARGRSTSSSRATRSPAGSRHRRTTGRSTRRRRRGGVTGGRRGPHRRRGRGRPGPGRRGPPRPPAAARGPGGLLPRVRRPPCWWRCSAPSGSASCRCS